jgi:hypothetical protein
MRSPYARLSGEVPLRIGHNGGPPLDPVTTWRRVAWGKARRALVGHIPLELVRMRIRRARELGLEYPAYASVLLGTGRDITAFLFTAEAIGLRLQHGVALPEATAAKLLGLARCDRLLLAEPGADPTRLAAALALAHRIEFRGAGAAPHDQAGLPEGRAAIRDILAPLKLPADAVVMIGTRAAERDWAEAARLAKFMAAERYFGA